MLKESEDKESEDNNVTNINNTIKNDRLEIDIHHKHFSRFDLASYCIATHT